MEAVKDGRTELCAVATTVQAKERVNDLVSILKEKTQGRRNNAVLSRVQALLYDMRQIPIHADAAANNPIP
jgi:hypothetical protein